jgi:hypothetical protein
MSREDREHEKAVAALFKLHGVKEEKSSSVMTVSHRNGGSKYRRRRRK